MNNLFILADTQVTSVKFVAKDECVLTGSIDKVRWHIILPFFQIC